MIEKSERLTFKRWQNLSEKYDLGFADDCFVNLEEKQVCPVGMLVVDHFGKPKTADIIMSTINDVVLMVVPDKNAFRSSGIAYHVAKQLGLNAEYCRGLDVGAQLENYPCLRAVKPVGDEVEDFVDFSAGVVDGYALQQRIENAES